ncbi:MAG: hypothetical protein R2764_13705 [Bacteroidales bacterium]
MGKTINSDRLDYCPFVSHDGKYLFFTSNRMDSRFYAKDRKNIETIYSMADNIKNGLDNIYWVEFQKDNWR